MANRNDEHNKHCKAIVNNLIAYADGKVYKCPECGHEFEIDEEIERIECPMCHIENEPDDLEQLTLWDYFEGMLDIDYIIDSNREYKACRIMMACGGPNIYINTWDKKVELYWWTESGEAWLPSEICDEIDSFMEDLYHC